MPHVRRALAMLFSLLLLGQLGSLTVHREVSATSAQPFSLEGRGIWVHPSYFSPDPELGPSEIRDTFALYKSLNINFILFLVKDPRSWVYYNSEINPVHPNYRWDPLNVSIREAHALGLEIHAWFCVFPEGISEMQDHGLLHERPDLAMVDIDGNRVPWACPAKEEVRDYEMSLILEVATRYDVDGIHLDYIRYPNSKVCYCDHCRSEFKKKHGFDPLDKPEDPLWISWKCSQVSRFVNETYTRIKRIRPELKLSAAVFRNPQGAVTSVHQDWRSWIVGGYIDFVAPMAYIESLQDFQESVENILSSVNWRVPVYVGIGLHKLPDAEALLDQVYVTRVWGAQGQVLFCCHHLKEEFTEALKNGPYSDSASPPHRDYEDEKESLVQGQARYEATLLTAERLEKTLKEMDRTLIITRIWAVAATLTAAACFLWLVLERRRRSP